jgi:hypothetical protein
MANNEIKHRASKQELEQRVFKIQGWIIEGVPEFLIKKQAVVQWNISFKTAKRYIQMADDGLKPDRSVSLEDKLARKIVELQQRKRTIEEKSKYTPQGIKALNDIDKMLIRLEAIEPPRRIQIQGDAENPLILGEGFTPEKEARLKALTEKLLNTKSYLNQDLS